MAYMTLTDLARECPTVELAPGSELWPSDLTGAALLVVNEGLVVLRNVAAGSTRRTITCYAGAGALIPGGSFRRESFAVIARDAEPDLAIIFALR